MKICISILMAIALGFLFGGITKAIEPSNPNTSPEARALLQMFYDISGKYTLTGQHNYPNTKDRNTRFATHYAGGQTPVIWSTDMGFAKEGDSDSYLARPDIVREAIRQHKRGSLITICWHAVPPTADEPVTFQPRGKVHPDSLASVQGRLPDYQFRDILTPGTALYRNWAAQVDSVAHYLKLLADAKVPVLWRPYHEMNGDWFWWGGRTGEFSTAGLYRQLYDRLVNYHKLNNLVWVWNVDRPSTPIRKFSNFYPGDKYLDILSLDVYGSDFNQAYYDSLLALSNGKPILFGEVGNPPSSEILQAQPKWTSWVIWAGFVRNTPQDQFKQLVSDPRILSMEDEAYQLISTGYRKACGFPVLPVKSRYPVDFTGQWLLDEGKSEFGNNGPGNTPYQMRIEQQDEQILVKKSILVEWDDDRISHDEIWLDGEPVRTQVYNTPRITTTVWDDASRSVKILSIAKFDRGTRSVEIKNEETWTMEDGGKTLQIIQTSVGFSGEKTIITLLYHRQ